MCRSASTTPPHVRHRCRNARTASLQPVNRYRPHFPVKPGLSGRKRNAVLPVVANSVLWDVMCQSNWSLSAAPLRLSIHNVRNWPVAGATISCRLRCLQNPLHAVMPERGFWPMLSLENMQTICRYTASQKYTVVREWSWAVPHWGAGQVQLMNCWSRCITSCASMC